VVTNDVEKCITSKLILKIPINFNKAGPSKAVEEMVNDH
jgi:hypothetical protein